MPELDAEGFLATCSIDSEVLALRPEYRALLIIVEGIGDGLDDDSASADRARYIDERVEAAEAHARGLLAEHSVEDLPHIAAWREAYRGFGAKPQRTRNSLEALTRRATAGLPRVNAITDLYNAISVLHQIPIGGEDVERYVGRARLTRATGEEPFETTASGESVVEHPEPGEVIWRDDAGATCRRWNWRQGTRTALTDTTRTALFILDALPPLTDEELHAAGDALVDALSRLGANVHVTSRLVTR